MAVGLFREELWELLLCIFALVLQSLSFWVAFELMVSGLENQASLFGFIIFTTTSEHDF